MPILRRRTPKGIDNPFNMSGCEVLLFVCRGCLRCVALFSYCFDNLGFITEGNTLPSLCYVIPPSPGKYQRSSSYHQGEFLAPLSGRIFNITRFLIINLISLQFTLFAICLSLSSPPHFTKIYHFIRLSFSFHCFLVRSILCLES